MALYVNYISQWFSSNSKSVHTYVFWCSTRSSVLKCTSLFCRFISQQNAMTYSKQVTAHVDHFVLLHMEIVSSFTW